MISALGEIKQSDVGQIVVRTPSQISDPTLQREAKEINICVMSFFMKESEDGCMCDLKAPVISSWVDSSGRVQLCQAVNENQAVVFPSLQIDGRTSLDDEGFEDVESIFKEKLVKHLTQ